METSKKWITVAIALTCLAIIPLFLYIPQILSQDSIIPLPNTHDDRSSMIVSTILHTVWTIISLWGALYIGNYYKNIFKKKGISSKFSNFLGAIFALGTFILVYFIFALPLTDNRTAEGYVAFINFESISHLNTGLLYGVLITIITLFI